MQAIDISSRRMHRRREPLSGSTHEKGKYSHPRLSFTKYGRDVFSFRQSRAKLWPLTNKNRTLKLIEQFSTVKLSTLQSKFLQRKSPFHRSFFLRPKQFLFFFFSTSLFSCNTLNASLYNFGPGFLFSRGCSSSFSFLVCLRIIINSENPHCHSTKRSFIASGGSLLIQTLACFDLICLDQLRPGQMVFEFRI